MSKKCILIIGGARSGKSQFALEMASSLDDKVLFVATGEPLDEEMRERIEEHKKRRPSGWRTIEVPTGVGRRIKEEIRDARVVILDCLTLLVSNVMSRCGDAEQVDPKLALEIKELIECIDGIDASCIIVSNEVGMGLVPENRLGRLYRDLLGKVNQELARHADEVRLMVAGMAVDVKGPGGYSSR